ATWNQATIGAEFTLSGLDFVDAGHGWLATDDGILHSSDGGATWIVQALPDVDATEGLQDIHFVNSTTGWAVGMHGQDSTPNLGFILKTSTGGE
ncbi:MAG TPA: YCF48-related protein, partial [Planctomycetota bacterium]|nr:YCF48-related protein [Planctomycetota bacterium]